MSSGEASGVPARGYSWPPFEKGHELSVRHGAYADGPRFGRRVDELTGTLRPLVPTYREADEVTLRLLCLSLVRLERSAAAINDPETTATDLARLRLDERGWANTARRYLNDLGMTPMARAKLKLDVAITARALTLSGLAEELEELEGEAVEESEQAEP